MAIRHDVTAGDCIGSIGFRYGLHPETIWSDAANEELRGQRATGYVLHPGDVVMVPERRRKEVPRPTGAVHRFRRLGVPEKIELQLADDEEPRAGLSYKLIVDGMTREGTTDADGLIDEWIPPGAREAKLEIDGEEVIDLRLGFLVPPEDADGLTARLVNLSWLDEDAAGDPNARASAIRAFQKKYQLDENGTPDAATAAKLVEIHGC